MATTANGFYYPASTDPPDGPGQIYQLANSLQTFFQQGDGAPGFGGTGASLGSGGTIEGSYTRVGQRMIYDGRVQFGSGGTFGTGTPSLSNINIIRGLNPNRSTGSGHYYRSGTNLLPLMFVADYPNSTQWVIRLVRDGYTDNATAITVNNGDQFRFTIQGILS